MKKNKKKLLVFRCKKNYRMIVIKFMIGKLVCLKIVK